MKKKDFEDVVRLTEVLTMRYLIVGNQNPNELERKYSEWAIWIRSHRPLGDAYNDAKSLLSQTPDFVKGFGQMSGLPSPQVRYILRKIEEYKTSKELEVAWNGVDIEHILPQTPPDDWTAAIGQTEKKLSEISEMLGNLTIIDKRMNRSASNKSFQTKVEQYYKKSKISITSDLQHFGQWNVDTINQRQQEFAKMADDIWNLERAWR